VKKKGVEEKGSHGLVCDREETRDGDERKSGADKQFVNFLFSKIKIYIVNLSLWMCFHHMSSIHRPKWTKWRVM